MSNALLLFGLLTSVIGGVFAAIAQGRPAVSPTERWATRGVVLFAAAGLFNVGVALAFPHVEWVRILGAVIGFAFTAIGFGAVWHMRRRANQLRAEADSREKA